MGGPQAQLMGDASGAVSLQAFAALCAGPLRFLNC
jgi:hypothetical protein